MSVIASLVCWMRGHQWRVLRSTCHRASLVNLHTLAGTIAKCDRCKYVHHDECMSCELSPRSPELAAEIGP